MGIGTWSTRWIGPLVGVLMAGGTSAAQEAPRPQVLEGLGRRVGTWTSESRATPEGRGFHFVYELRWFDVGETMLEMRITQHFDDGEERLQWTGFKGWDPVRGAAYYHGFSPGGRAATGVVTLTADTLVTEYRGWGLRGPPVEIRDVFHPVVEGSFLSVTYMRQDDEWAEIMRDRWRRSGHP